MRTSETGFSDRFFLRGNHFERLEVKRAVITGHIQKSKLFKRSERIRFEELQEVLFMGMVVNHNLPAINANRQLGINNKLLSKSIEKLSSGMQINRAADNAAGLAISEKMRGQINGLEQASKNAQDGISLIQTAEGALNETHDILQRMRTLAVQSANGTYQDEVDREAIQLEVDALKSEIDRISTSTHYNGIKLLDGSLGGASNSTEYGAKYGIVSTTADDLEGATVTSNIAGVKVTTTIDKASGKGGENALWSANGKELKLNLVKGQTYTQEDIDNLIANATQSKDAGQTGAPADVKLTLKNGIMTATAASDTGVTAAGLRATGSAAVTALVGDATNGAHGSADKITFTANTYGKSVDTKMAAKITIDTSAEAGKESVTVSKAATSTDAAEISLKLSTGVEYTEKDIENLLKEAGYDYSVKLEDTKNTDGDADGKIYFNSKGTAAVTITDGAGVGKEMVKSTGKGLTFQIGANGVADQRVTLNVDDMSSSALKVANISVATREGANKAIDVVDNAINTVSMQRAGLGALQNRLEHTINSLDVANENLTAAESAIRDTDMAKEMMKFTKQQILSQASQAMLAQANQLPQGVLQLLQ